MSELMANQCRLAIDDIENYMRKKDKFVFHVKKKAFGTSYVKTAKRKNELVILQAPDIVDPELNGHFRIDGYNVNHVRAMIFAHQIIESEA